MRVAAGLHVDARAGNLREIESHHGRRTAVEAEWRLGHASLTNWYEFGDASLSITRYRPLLLYPLARVLHSLAQDAIMSKRTTLEADVRVAVAQIHEVGSIIPVKNLVEYHEIESLEDFAGVGFTSEEDKEVDRLLNARAARLFT